MSEEVFIVFGDSVQRVADDNATFDEVLDQVRGTFSAPPLEIEVHLQPRGFENRLLQGTLMIGSNVTVARFGPRLPWPGKSDEG